MNEYARTRMLLTTAVFAAVAALLAGAANAFVMDVEGGGGNGYGAVVQPGDPGTIQSFSHGIGVYESRFEGDYNAIAKPGDPGTIPYLSHGIGVDESLFSGEQSLGLTGDSALTRISAPEPEGLTGDSALTRYPAQGRGVTVAASSSDDTDWTWFGVGAGMAALVAAGIAGVLLTSRHRGRVALP